MNNVAALEVSPEAVRPVGRHSLLQQKNNSIQARSKRSVASSEHFSIYHTLFRVTWLGHMNHLFCVKIHSPYTKKRQNLWHKYSMKFPQKCILYRMIFAAVFFHWLLLDRLPQLHSWCKSSPADRRSAISSSNFYEFIIWYKWIGKRFPNS